MNIIELKQVGSNDIKLVGGKAASLGELMSAGLPVPAGFVITTSAYKSGMTVKLSKDILNAFKKLGVDRVAVRSSAISEDSQNVSWAGQLETYLNINKDNLIASVKKCWESTNSEHAKQYAKQNKIKKADNKVAVIVQAMVDSDISGVMFTANPINNSSEEYVIEAIHGLGELLVQGQVTPETLVINKNTIQTINYSKSTQKKMLTNVESKNKLVGIPANKLNNKIINIEVINKLNIFARKIENHYKGVPQDIEWAVSGKDIFIVQSRPITTLATTTPKLIFEKTFTREESLMLVELLCLEIDKWLDKITSKKPISMFFYVSNGLTETWLCEQATKLIINDVYKNNKINDSYLNKTIAKYKDLVIELKEYEDKKYAKDINELLAYFDIFKQAIVPLHIIFFTPYHKDTPKLLSDLAIKIRSQDALFDNADIFVRDTLVKICPNLDNYETLVGLKDLPIMNVNKIKKRYKNFLWINNQYINTKINIFQNNHPEYQYINHDIKNDINTIKGEPAYPGLVTAKASVVLRKKEVGTFKRGNILVAPMTTPHYLPAMIKAKAFVTDEGGVTCHAAIVAREMKIPCIIGTKTATKVIKNNDKITVDATDSKVLLHKQQAQNTELLNSSDILKSNNYMLAFKAKGVNIFITDIHSEIYERLDGLFIIDKGTFSQYFSNTAYQQALEEGLNFYSSKTKFNTYINNLHKHCANFEKFYIDNIKNQNSLTKKQVKMFIEYTKILCSEYTKMNFEYTDKAFELQSKNIVIKNNLESVAKNKDIIRDFMNRVLFEPNGFTNTIFKILSKQFSIPASVIENLTQAEILQLFDGLKPNQTTVRSRQNMYVQSNKLNINYQGKLAQDIINKFAIKNVQSKIQGQCANRGKAEGRVCLISADYTNGIALEHSIASMKESDILVSETTSPDMIMACKKAGAIITDLGGMLSHAAIVSRELGIPCIVGTGNATKVLKKGDLVLVNANEGLVKVINDVLPAQPKKPKGVKYALSVPQSVLFADLSLQGNLRHNISKALKLNYEPKYIAIDKDGAMSWNYDKDAKFIKEFTKNKDIILATNDFIYNMTTTARKLERRTNIGNNINRRNNNIKDIIEDIQEYWKAYTLNMSSLFIYWNVEALLFNYIYTKYKEQIKLEPQLINEYLKPQETNQFIRERRCLKKIIDRFSDSMPIYKEKISDEFRIALEHHIQEFSFILEPFNIKKHNDVNSLIDRINQTDINVDEYTSIDLENVLEPNFKEALETLQKLAFWKNARIDVMSFADSLIQPIYDEIAHFLKIPSEHLFAMTSNEIIKSLNAGKVCVPKNTINSRLKSFCIILYKGKIDFYKTTVATKITKNVKNVKQPQKLYGFVASNGVAKGQVRIVNNNKDLKLFVKGEILVTKMTRPEYGSALDKASGFITEEGGLLCHAAIISREMKKPCITNVKNVTNLLKTGTTVNLDANKGTINIISN